MVDYMGTIPALALTALLLGSAVPASAQQLAHNCVANGGLNTPLRAESLTDKVGDVIISCTGGTATPYGTAVISTVNIQIFLNTSITSRLMAGSTTLPQLSEALLILDEPGPTSQFGCPTSTCTNYGNGSGAPIYGVGSFGTASNNKNVFQGIQSVSNVVTFFGIPIDPPGTSGSRIIRITNIRGNANALGFADANAPPTPVIATIVATTPYYLPVSNPVQTVGSVVRGLQFSVLPASGGTFTPPDLQQCVSRNNSSTNIAKLRYSSLFSVAFKKRFVSSGVFNPSGGPPPQQSGPMFGAYNTESGFVNTALTLPANTFGATTVGLADWGTRLKAVFNNVPNGVNLFVDRVATSGNYQATLTAAEAGVFSTVPASANSPLSNSTAQLTVVNNSATAIWEVVESDPTAFATLDFRVWVTYTASPGTNSPGLATATVNGSYAPTSTVTTSQNPLVPRFADISTASNLFTIVSCVSGTTSRFVVTQPGETIAGPRASTPKPLLFTYVVNQFGWDTEITISNTSQDTLGSAAQSGSCALNYYGTNLPMPLSFTSSPIPAGKQLVFRLSQGGGGIGAAPGFSGYIVAVCSFPLARGLSKVFALNGSLAFAHDAQPITTPRSTANPQFLLFPFVTSQSGFDTGFAIANTGADPFGTTPSSGSCTLSSYGANAPSPLVTPTISPGFTYSNLASSFAPNFQGYVIASCNFNAASGIAFVADLGAQKFAFSETAELLATPRSAVAQSVLFPSVSNQDGVDSSLAIANTSLDPFGTTATAGSCTLNYYGGTLGGGAAPSPQTSTSIAAGDSLVFTLSSGGNHGIAATPGFKGYIIAACSFPLARGWEQTTTPGSSLDGDAQTADLITLPRSTAASTLLFSAATGRNGADTDITISNTSQDPFGTSQSSGACTISYFGDMAGGGSVPAPRVSTIIQPGKQLSFNLSVGNAAQGLAAAPGFHGYVIADCGFPLARGLATITQTPPSKLGVFNAGQAAWLLDSNGNYAWDGTPTDFYKVWGSANTIPVVGDWNGNGTKKIGIFNPTNGFGCSISTAMACGMDRASTSRLRGARPVTSPWLVTGTAPEWQTRSGHSARIRGPGCSTTTATSPGMEPGPIS